ncbi:Na+/H+ antiporter NhaA [Thalassotalea sp. G2M2-11]|uniref:Na+/H+ antiporter NhaA n=1 Tax=Thalassotalea sp. G2M2-11 TaxID=2787627 RepID=UPI0019D03CDC|nr:Na+/H+ antiporter NhaA [Thalassotalea sp. G2M2-11]
MKLEIKEQNRERMPLEKPFEKVVSPFENFVQSQTAAGLFLLLFTLIAMVWVNSTWSDSYHSFINAKLGIFLDDFIISHSLVDWMNEGLIVLFFFLLGLEIKYQILAGELQDIKVAMLAILMALGGMLIPASVYVSMVLLFDQVNAMSGWGIPMATDTAFAIGLLMLLGKRVPASVILLITALAIIDDMGAVLVIGIFYTEQLVIHQLIYAGVTLLALFMLNLLGIRSRFFYLIGALILWWFVYHSGIHATTAGILAALTVPTKPYADTNWFSDNMTKLLTRFKQIDSQDKSILEQQQQHELAETAKQIAHSSTTPIQRWESALDKPISLLVLPLFALLNAGVMIPEQFADVTHSAVFWGSSLGLVIGKCLGIFGFAYVGLKLNWVHLPDSLTNLDLLGLSCFAGIGFTMSLFIANLAFAGQALLLDYAKLGVIFGSLCAIVFGMTCFMLKRTEPHHG